MEDSRKSHKREQTKFFKNVYVEFLKDNKGYSNPLDYIEGVYEGDKNYWAKVARWAGFKCIKRNGVFYFEA